MTRQKAPSVASHDDSALEKDAELNSVYDYLAKVILIGPSGCGKSCLLHRFMRDEWRVFSSQTIGVEFASKIVKVGTSSREKRIKLQLWDTAGTERFRSVSRSYYRGAAGAILVYDMASYPSFTALPTFLSDARALASPHLIAVLAGSKSDLLDEPQQPESSLVDLSLPPTPPLGTRSRASSISSNANGSIKSGRGPSLGTCDTATVALEGRQVTSEEAARWSSFARVPLSMEVSALSGDNVNELFSRLARMILAKIELGEIDPDDPQSGIQYGVSGGWFTGASDGGSIRSGVSTEERPLGGRGRRQGRQQDNRGAWMGGLREWEEVFRIDNPRRRGGCC